MKKFYLEWFVVLFVFVTIIWTLFDDSFHKTHTFLGMCIYMILFNDLKIKLSKK